MVLTQVVQACYDYHLTWAWVLRVSGELPGKCPGISECLESGHPLIIVRCFVLLQRLNVELSRHQSKRSGPSGQFMHSFTFHCTATVVENFAGNLV